MPEPTRVLLLSHAYAPPVNRKKLISLSSFRELELKLLTPSFWKEGGRVWRTRSEKAGGYELIAGGVFLPGRLTAHFYRSGLFGTLKNFDPHIVHLEEEPWSAVAAQILLFRRILGSGFRLIVFSWENIYRELGFPYKEFERTTLRGATFFIAGNGGARRVLEAKGFPRERIALLHQLGVDPEEFSPSGETPGEDFRVIFVGRLVAQKGVETLLRAAAELPGRVRLVILGDGPLRQELKGLTAELGLEGRVEFLGAVDHEGVPGVLRNCHALALPSLTTPDWAEQFGHVLIEAMSCGVPVVGSTSGAIPEVVGDAGILFPEGDSGALAGALRSLLEDEGLRRRLAERGRKRVLEHYTWDRLAAETLSIYRQCLEREPFAGRAGAEGNP